MNEVVKELLEGIDLTERKVIEGLTRYEVDLSKGDVWDRKRQIWLNPKPNARKYKYVNLQTDDNKRKVISMHRLVILAALDGFDYRKLFAGLNLVVDHISGDRTDNRFLNLNIMPQSMNLKGREYNPVRLNNEQLTALYNDFYLIDEAKHGEKHEVYQMLSEKYDGYSTHSIQVRYLKYRKNKVAELEAC